MLKKHLPLVDRITTRDELSDLIGWMVGELSVAAHLACAAATCARGPTTSRCRPWAPGWCATRRPGATASSTSTRTIPTIPTSARRSPTRSSSIDEGDVITAVNGVEALSVEHPTPSCAARRSARCCCGVKAGRGRRVARRHRGADHRRDGTCATPTGSTRAALAVEETKRRQAGLRPPARHGRRRPDRLVPPVLSRPSTGRAWSSTSATTAAATSTASCSRSCCAAPGCTGRPGRRALLEHAVRLPRPHGRAGRRGHRLGRRGLRRGLPAPGPRQGDRHADVGRRDLAVAASTS